MFFNFWLYWFSFLFSIDCWILIFLQSKVNLLLRRISCDFKIFFSLMIQKGKEGYSYQGINGFILYYGNSIYLVKEYLFNVYMCQVFRGRGIGNGLLDN